MKKFIIALAILGTMFALTTLSACSSETKTDDHLISFKDGNVYMPQSLCDQEEQPNLSPKTEQKLKDWWASVGTPENPDGEVVCTK